MSAVTFAVAPTVSFPSPSWTAPSTVPSMCRSSSPEISPFTCRLDPSRAVARSAAAPVGGITSLFIWLFSPKTLERAFATDSLAQFSVPGPQVAAYPVSCYPHIGPP